MWRKLIDIIQNVNIKNEINILASCDDENFCRLNIPEKLFVRHSSSLMFSSPIESLTSELQSVRVTFTWISDYYTDR